MAQIKISDSITHLRRQCLKSKCAGVEGFAFGVFYGMTYAVGGINGVGGTIHSGSIGVKDVWLIIL